MKRMATLGLGFTALLISSILSAEPQKFLDFSHQRWTLLAYADVAKNFLFMEPQQQQLAASTMAKGLVINNDVVYDPDRLSLDSFQTYEKSFNYNWNDASTIGKNKAKILEIENFFNENPNDWSQLASKDREACGRILYKLGTYYLHADKNPDLAIAKIVAAQPFLQSKSDQAWAYNQLAYAFERKYQKSHENKDKDKAVGYLAKVTNLYKNAKCKEMAFASNVQSLIEKDSMGLWEERLLAALRVYELIGNGNLYARVKTRLAKVIFEIDDSDDEALTLLKDVKKYWQIKGNIEGNPFAASHLVALSHAYIKLGKASCAGDEIDGAIRTYQNICTDSRPMLYEPYLSLSDIKLGVYLSNQKISQASSVGDSKEKASHLN